MSNFPGLYIDIGKHARDLLYKDYAQQQPIHFHYQCVDWNLDLSCRVESMVPGLHTAFRFLLPDSGKVELRYLQDYIGISAGTGFKTTPHNSLALDPVVNFSGVIGSSLFSLGTEIAFDVSTSTFDKLNAGVGFNSAFLIASVTLNKKLDTVKASVYQAVNPLTRTAFAAELKHRFSRDRTPTVTVGAQHALFPSTLLKARMDTEGKVGAVVQQGFWQKFFISIAGEIDFRDSNKSPEVGFSMALRP